MLSALCRPPGQVHTRGARRPGPWPKCHNQSVTKFCQFYLQITSQICSLLFIAPAQARACTIPLWNCCKSFPKWMIQFSSVQSLSHVRLIATPCIAARQASLSITNSRSSLKLIIFLSREGRDLGVAFQAPPGSQASSRGQSIGASVSASVLPMNIQC